MRFEIYHQLGFRYKWNLESIQNENSGDGIIIAPRHMKKEEVEKLDIKTNQKAIFDPQMFNPHKVHPNMSTYGFYPSMIMPDGFSTGKYSPYSSHCANQCIDFQIEKDFRFITIPTRYYGEMPSISDLIAFQNEQFVNPFLTYIKNQKISKDVILQVVLNGYMIKNKEYASDLLTWITGVDGIKGVYLITEFPHPNRQIEDSDFLLSLLDFVDVLYQNELIVILGYLNAESLLLSIANPSIVTIGSYGNLRIFDSSKYWDDAESGRGPNRIYVPKLLDWIEFDYFALIKNNFPNFLDFSDNEYTRTLLSPSYNGNAVKLPFQHFFIEGSKQLRDVNALDNKDRYIKVCEIIESAIRGYSELEKAGFRLDKYGSNLPKWLTAANLFASKRGWRR